MADVVLIVERIRVLLWVIILLLSAWIAFLLLHGTEPKKQHTNKQQILLKTDFWTPPSLSTISNDTVRGIILYGKNLIEHTARYLGPEGTVMRISNGMNCQNCHLNAGTKPFAANYSAVASTYPKFRARSGTVEGFEKRINDCIERSLNGTRFPPESRELKAIVAYLKWIGKDVPQGEKPTGSGLKALPFLNRAADSLRGSQHYVVYCASCHGSNGEGVRNEGQVEWKYPPLWGPDSYNTGAGLYRISMFAAFIKANMPFGTSYENPVLSDEEAWDIAAFVNSQHRPHKEFPNDWPDRTKKPMDHPFGPYADSYNEQRHKYGPFGEIEANIKK